MIKKFKQSGFTIIELLVVIAIIGVLASIILVALNSARNKGTDAKVKANLSALRTQAELFYDKNDNYGTTSDICVGAGAGTLFLDPNIAIIVDGASYPGLQTVRCRALTGGAGGYAVSIS